MTRRRSVSYIGACALLAACPGPRTLAPLVPVGLAPASRDSAIAWTNSTLPRRFTVIRFRWRYQDERVKYAGRGTARIAPPDSLRFDYAGPLGLGSGAAVIIGDSVLWAEPAGHVRSLIPAIPMLWAALGMVQPPADDATVFTAWIDSAADDGNRRRVWRFAQLEDTLDYVVTDSAGRMSRLEAEWRRREHRVARSRSQLDARGEGRPSPKSARVDFPEASGGGARFELSVVAVDTGPVMAPALWRHRR